MFLPDGTTSSYFRLHRHLLSASKPSRIRVGALDTRVTTLVEAESPAIYASGHLLFTSRNHALMAQPFDHGISKGIGVWRIVARTAGYASRSPARIVDVGIAGIGRTQGLPKAFDILRSRANE